MLQHQKKYIILLWNENSIKFEPYFRGAQGGLRDTL